MVSVSGRQLLVEDAPYIIKGVCYHPVSKGETKRSFEMIDTDLALMKEAGINTIRVYTPIAETEVLDKIHRAGIKVIIGFGYNQQGNYDMVSATCLDYVQKFKDHPAILFWELGNEYNYHPEWFDGDVNNWYTALREMTDKIHDIDPDHPVATAHGELPSKEVLALCPNIDIWGMNVYRWDRPGALFDQWEDLSEKPMYLSEAGADSYMTVEGEGFAAGENEDAQANALTNILDQTMQRTDITMGVTVFAFTDEWWKAGDPDKQDAGGWAPGSSGVPYDGTPNEEYWGLLDIDRNKKKAYFVVKVNYDTTDNNQ